eukprot:CAMPEP_0167759172 /NCGR_PEP_ID=MMETSP0110_2-20121227/10872_1 /TAXON_ID=629695 /ORGANISM="Gymnochlora sp., Strain CCMP2014" /LENGTH=1283 /DNA_ID=CAMNT_0007645521 /DNA_START=139 /DNA_END=3990 /DNA_ORIENTATION=-
MNEMDDGPFSRWLKSLELSIEMPPITTKILFATASLDLKMIKCKNTMISRLGSQYNQDESTLAFDVEGVHIDCTIPSFDLTVNVSKLHFSIASGTASADVLDQSYFKDQIQVSGSGGLARKAKNLYCKANIKCKFNVDLNGWPTWIVNGIVDLAEGAIDSAIEDALCKELDSLIAVNMTNLLLGIDEDIEPYISPSCCLPNTPPDVPEGTIDWSNNSVAVFLEDFLDNTVGVDGPLNINDLIDRFTDSTGVLDLPIGANFTFTAVGATVTLHIRHLHVEGLHSFESFQFFGLSGNAQAFNTSLRLGILNVTLDMLVFVDPGHEVLSGEILTEAFTVHIGLEDPEFHLKTVVAVYEEVAKNLSIGRVFEPSCLADAFYTVNFTEISVNTSLGVLAVVATGEGDIERGLDSTINNIVSLFTNDYVTVVPDLIHGLLYGPIRELANEALGDLISNYTAISCEVPPVSSPKYINWTDGVIGSVLEIINGVTHVDAPLDINWVLGRLLGADSHGRIKKTGELFKLEVQDGMTVSLNDLAVQGVTGLTEINLLEAKDWRTLFTSMDIWMQSEPLNISLWIDVNISDPEFYDRINVQFGLTELKIPALKGIIQVVKQNLSDILLTQLSNGYCLASLSDFTELTEIDLGINKSDIRLHGGHSKSFIKFESEVSHFDTLLTEIINFVFELAQSDGLGLINPIIKRQLYEAPYKCAGVPIPSDDSEDKKSKTATIVAIVTALGTFLIITVALLIWRNRKFKKKTDSYERIATVTQSMPHSSSSGSQEEKSDAVTPQSANSEIQSAPKSFPPWNCLAANPNIPWIFRFGVPIILAGNFAIFIVSNLGVGAAVELQITAGSIEAKLPSLFEFTLTNTIVDMWKAKVYPLSILVALFSGGWPYLKLGLMMLCWLFPLSWLNPKRREDLLIALDALGKWSLLDSYVLSLMLVAFRFNISNPTSEIPVEFFEVDVYVEPGLGFYLFLLATILSLLTTHVVLHYHRFSQKSERLRSGGISSALCNHEFHGDSYGFEKDKRIRCSIFGKIVISIMLLSAFGVILVGSMIKSFNFEFRGLASIFLGDQVTRSYSLLSVTEAIPKSSSDPHSVGIIWIQAVFYLVSFAVPLTHLVVLFVLWWVPMTAKIQYSVFYATEILNAWSALDVFIVSIIAAILEIQQFAKFLVGNKCDQINDFIQKYLPGSYDGTCFTVIATLQEGCWVLFFACVLSLAVSQAVMRTCHKAMHDRLERVASESLLNDSDEEEKKETAKAETSEEGEKNGCRDCCGRFLLRMGLLKLA